MNDNSIHKSLSQHPKEKVYITLALTHRNEEPKVNLEEQKTDTEFSDQPTD
jgi:hypothetical protein